MSGGSEPAFFTHAEGGSINPRGSALDAFWSPKNMAVSLLFQPPPPEKTRKKGFKNRLFYFFGGFWGPGTIKI